MDLQRAARAGYLHHSGFDNKVEERLGRQIPPCCFSGGTQKPFYLSLESAMVICGILFLSYGGGFDLALSENCRLHRLLAALRTLGRLVFVLGGDT